MPKYILVYRGGMPKNRQQATVSIPKWKSWITGLGTAIVDPGQPAKNAKELRQSGATASSAANPISGYSIVQADSEQVVLQLAKSCPIFDDQGTVEVGELIDVS